MKKHATNRKVGFLVPGVCLVLLFLLSPMGSLRAHATTMRTARDLSGMYGTQSFRSNQAGPERRATGFWEGLGEVFRSVNNELNRMKNGNLSRDDGKYEIPLGNTALRSETAFSVSNGVDAYKEINNYSIPTNPKAAAEAVSGVGASDLLHNPDNINTINNFTEKTQAFRESDRAIRSSTRAALREAGFDEGTIDAYVRGGQEAMDEYFNSHVDAQNYYRTHNTTWTDAKALAMDARYRDACRHGRLDEARAIKAGKYDEYMRQRAAKNNAEGNTGPTNNVAVEKPNIYLYPVADTRVEVTFQDPKALTQTIPAYGDGWEVMADPAGCLTLPDSGEQYDFLFYEADVVGSGFRTEEGFALPAEDRQEVYEKVLTAYGLNDREIADFIEYWTPRLSEGEDYMMYPQEEALVEELMPMEVNPRPENLLRLWFIFEQEESPADTMAISEIHPVDRSGYTVIEWGGAVLE